jgi:NAD(P)-dependent dehydrogenase (short-subunit alcohol dehydrogenase family)
VEPGRAARAERRVPVGRRVTLPRTPSLRLDGRRALVAGGSSGIGLAAAAALAEAGSAVTLAARRAERLEAAVAEMRAEGWQAEAAALDVADIEATARIVAAQGPFDILVNSAGLARHGPAAETAPEDFDAVMEVNLRGAYFLAQAVARGLIETGRPGSIVTISSQMGHVGGIDRAVYCASKFAVEGFTKAMAIEWGRHGIRVNTLCPTFVRTELTEATFQDPARRAWIEEKIKLGRVGRVEDIMGAVLYLASDASSLVTGSALMVDGGWTAD